ncbi:MAG: bifunctional alpha/beta hydrolase/OsmC family protein [Planctomycetota bacterium]
MAIGAPRSERVTFENAEGEALAARLDLPPLEEGGGRPRAYCVFAHCFTCSKDIHAASRVARTLASRGFGVLRFDFTGLGSSDGDFANTNFSSNVEDLLRAADYLREHHGPVQLLVGHSLGGAAVLAAARRIDTVEAVATIGAPSDPGHVAHHFAASIDEIEARGEADVTLAGRSFRIKKQFLDDIGEQKLGGAIGDLDAALLVMHAPLDDTVPISEARKIYEAARGFKSFVSLGDADHLLTKRTDAEYAADLMTAWARKYVTLADAPEPAAATATATPAPDAGDVRVEEIERPYTNVVRTHRHAFLADEPAEVGGNDRGGSPFELLLASLGACTTMTLRMYADRKKWPLENVRIDMSLDKEATDDPKHPLHRFTGDITIEGDLDAEQRERLIEIAGRCPVHRAIAGPKEITMREAARD